MKKIKFKNYKAFKGWQEIEIKPVTVFIGKNNSGKSAVMRLPILLGDAFFRGKIGIQLTLNIAHLEFGVDFTDLIFEKIETSPIFFEINFPKGTIEVKLQYLAEYESSVVTSFKFKKDESKIDISKENITIADGSYNISLNTKHNNILAEMKFKGIRPTKKHIPNIYDSKFNKQKEVNTALEEIAKIKSINLNYIRAHRSQPKRIYQKENFNASNNININLEQLAPYFLFRNIGFSKKIGAWYKKNLGGWRLEVNKISHYYELVFSKNNLKVNWVDSGHGMSQILPVIVQAFRSEKDSINIIEEPELYLHPSAHGVIAELIANKAIENKSFFMVETHSENFVLRLRRLVAEGKLSPDAVKIYWIDDDVEDGEGHQIKAINIDEKGEVDFWPEGIFSEDYAETLAIRRAQRKNK